MIITDILSALTIFIFMIFAKEIPLHLILLQSLLLLYSNIFSISSLSIFTDLNFNLTTEKANTILNSLMNLVNLFAPILGIFLYNLYEIKFILVINAITFLFSGILELFLSYTYKKKIKSKALSFIGTLKSYKEVTIEIYNRKDIFGISLYALLLNFFYSPLLFVLIPYLILNNLNLEANYIGYFELIWGIGLIIGNFLLYRYLDKINFKEKIYRYILAQFLMFVFFSVLNIFIGENQYILIFSALLLMLAAVYNTFVNVPFFSYLHESVDAKIKGRFFSIFDFTSQCVTPIGLIVFGILLELINNSNMIILVTSVVYLVFTHLYFKKTSFGKSYINKVNLKEA